jgi:hypothetical protein
MGSVTIHHKMNSVKVRLLLANPVGGLARNMEKRGERVQRLARANLLRPPHRYASGTLSRSIRVVKRRWLGYPSVSVGTDLGYARFVHDGTGIFGPKHHYIVPKHGKFLVFTPRGELVAVFAKRVKGMEPNPFLRDALKAAKI